MSERNGASLPADWQRLPISQLTVRTKQRDPRRTPTASFRYVDVSSVSNTSFTISEAAELVGANAPSRARKEILTDDVLFATVRPTLKRVAIVPAELNGQIASTGFIVLRADCSHVVPRYLYSRLLTDDFIKRMGELERGASYPAVRDSDVLNEAIPVPPLPEQQKIAAVLGLVQRAIGQQERLLSLTGELKKALLHQLFTQGLHNERQKQTELGPVPQTWQVTTLEKVASFQTGGTPSRSTRDYWSGGDIPWVKTTEINYKVIEQTEESITRKGLENSAAKIFPKGTVVVAMYGQGVTRGRVGILGIDAATNQACAAITPYDEDQIASLFIYFFVEFHYEQLRQLGHGANQRNLNMALLKNFPVAFPSRDEQIEIVRTLRILDSKLEIHQRKHATLSALFGTLLHELMAARIRIQDVDLGVLD